MRLKELGAKSEKNIKNGNELIEGKESFLSNKILTSQFQEELDRQEKNYPSFERYKDKS